MGLFHPSLIARMMKGREANRQKVEIYPPSLSGAPVKLRGK